MLEQNHIDTNFGIPNNTKRENAWTRFILESQYYLIHLHCMFSF